MQKHILRKTVLNSQFKIDTENDFTFKIILNRLCRPLLASKLIHFLAFKSLDSCVDGYLLIMIFLFQKF